MATKQAAMMIDEDLHHILRQLMDRRKLKAMAETEIKVLQEKAKGVYGKYVEELGEKLVVSRTPTADGRVHQDIELNLVEGKNKRVDPKLLADAGVELQVIADCTVEVVYTQARVKYV
jgi:hypothetical protein